MKSYRKLTYNTIGILLVNSIKIENEDNQCIIEQAYRAARTTDIHLVYQPKYVCVEVPSADPSKFAHIFSLYL